MSDIGALPLLGLPDRAKRLLQVPSAVNVDDVLI